MSDTRIGIIACGAVTEIGHLPTLQKLGRTAAALFDPNVERAGALATRFGVPRAAADYRKYVDDIDAAIIAAPHHMHGPIAIDLLQRGKHVLVEKPMAIDVATGEAMVAAADASGALLAVGLMRRFELVVRWTHDFLASGVLGELHNVDIEEGYVYGWPVASDTLFRKATAGGGVLMDTGPHTLDRAIWWLGDLGITAYRDDSRGGIEADCEIEFRTHEGAHGVMRLSRLRNLRNTAIIEGDGGWIEVSLGGPVVKASDPALLDMEFRGVRGTRLGNQAWDGMFEPQMRNFLAAIERGEPLEVDGREGLRSLRAIEQCYALREYLPMPWEAVEAMA